MLDHERDCYREVAAKALGRTGHAPFAVRLVEMLPDADRDVRREARGAAAHLYYIAERDGTSFPDVGPRLLELMEHQQPGTRAAAALLIGEIQYAKALEPLCRMLETDEDEDVRDAALRGLAHLEDPSSVDAVIGALEEKDPIMREIAAELLGELGDKRAVKPLAKLLRDKVGDVRIDAAQALAELPDPSVTAQLIRALGDDEHMVVSAAELALTRIGEPALPKLIAAYKRSRPSSHKRYLLLVLIGEHWDKRAVMTLISALGDRDRDVADLAFRILRNMACEDLGRKPGPWKRWWKEHGHAKPQGKCMKFYDLESVM